jgi:transposase
MLNTPPPSVTPVASRGGHSAAPLRDKPPFAKHRRKRGGQPSNHNALKHGRYAALHPTPLADFSNSISQHQIDLRRSAVSIRQTIQAVQEKFVSTRQMKEKTGDIRSRLAWDKLQLRSFKFLVRMKLMLFRQDLPMWNLQMVAKYALAILRFIFQDSAINRDADSFRVALEKSDLNSPAFQTSVCSGFSDPLYPFITVHQWAVIEPLLPPPDKTSRRGRPPADPRELLDAVFWKLAHHARWQDLPDYYPPMLTCRRYYRRLFLSGRLTTLYSALYKDLLIRGQADLSAFVKQGRFTIAGNTVTIKSDLDETWQTRTALLFLQLGYQFFRRYQRELKQARRRGYPSYRILPTWPFINQHKIDDLDSSFTPFDLAGLGS